MPALRNTADTPTLLTLGGLELTASDFKRTKPLLMLSYLCLEGQQARRRVAELFWPEAKDPLASLATDISRLKKACGEVVGADDTQVWAAVQTDARALLATLERREFQQAVETYSGAFLDGVHLNDWSVELEDWVYSTREFLAGRVSGAHVQLGERAAREGDFGAGARCANEACMVPGSGGLEPELAPRVYALLRADEHPHAANVKRASGELGLELTLTPAEARTQLRPAAPPLPTRGTSFVGRLAELAAVEDLFSQGEVRLLSLVGLAGMGKTRLAVQAANRLIQQGLFPDGVRLVELESLASPAELPYRLAATLQVELVGEASPVEAVAEAIQDQRVLLVLDNVEHLMDGVTVLPELLGRCPNLSMLVTSRERLNLTEEFVLWLEGLPFEGAASYLDAPCSDAFTLFVERAKRHRQGFDPSREDVAAIERVCRAVGGSPLATELAAALVNALSCEQIAEHLEQDLISLSGATRNLPERQASLRAALESSWRLLTEDEQRALTCLAVFRGGFTRDAAQRVAGAGLSRLVTLGDKALLRPQPSGRYDAHPLVHEFTKQKLSAQPELEHTRRQAHAAYFTSFLEARLEPIRGEGAKAVLKEVESELDNIRSAWDCQLEQRQAAELARGVFTLAHFFEFRGRAREGLDLFAATLQRLISQPDVPLALGKLHYASSWMFDHLGQTDLALQAAQEALSYYRSHGDRTLTAQGLSNLAGFIADHEGNYGQAAQLLEEARELLESEDRRYEAVLLTNLGVTQLYAGDYAAAERYLSQGKGLHDVSDNQMGVAVCLQSQGELFTLTGSFSQATLVLREGLALIEALSLEHFKPYFHLKLARLRRLQGDRDGAHEQIALALEQAQQLDHQQVMPEILAEYARITLANQDAESALRQLNQALAIAEKGEMLATTLHILVGFGEVLVTLGEHAHALRLARYAERQRATHAADRNLARGVTRTAISADKAVRDPKDSSKGGVEEGSLEDLVRELQDFVTAQRRPPGTAPASPPQSA